MFSSSEPVTATTRSAHRIPGLPQHAGWRRRCPPRTGYPIRPRRPAGASAILVDEHQLVVLSVPAQLLGQGEPHLAVADDDDPHHMFSHLLSYLFGGVPPRLIASFPSRRAASPPAVLAVVHSGRASFHLRAHDQRRRREVQPDQQHHNRSQGAVDHRVVGKVRHVERVAGGQGHPRRQGRHRARHHAPPRLPRTSWAIAYSRPTAPNTTDAQQREPQAAPTAPGKAPVAAPSQRSQRTPWHPLPHRGISASVRAMVTSRNTV